MEYYFKRAEAGNINYSTAAYDPIIRTQKKDGKLVLVMETEVPNLEVYYTIDDAMPDKFTAKYTKPVELPDGPITLRTITYRDGKPIGHLITLSRKQLEARAGAM
jgi:hexosaminidase